MIRESMTSIVHKMNPRAVKLTDDEANEVYQRALIAIADVPSAERTYELSQSIYAIKREYQKALST